MSTPKTSAVLYNLVLRAVEEMGLLEGGRKPVHGEALVPHVQKGNLLSLVYEQAGANAILAIGPRLLSYQSILAIAVMTRPIGPLETIRRWLRLERIYHSHHRVAVLQQDLNSITVRHEAISGPPPNQLDDLLIAGLLLALLEHQGCIGLEGSISGGEVFSRNGQRCKSAIVDEEDLSTWHFSWSEWDESATGEIPVAATVDGVVGEIESAFATDPADSWTLHKFSACCGLSERTLQRRLAEQGHSVRVLLRELRARTAAAMLKDDAFEIADIAFACGYADQPHLNREFRRCIGMPPSHYRSLLSETHKEISDANQW